MAGKFAFEDLKYVVMEGGGARGAAYLGAIRALEELMKKRNDVMLHPDVGTRTPGLLDYIDKSDSTPTIKGIAGSSAGAITTFALALGFNSDEIKEILDYEFKNFLKDPHAGKYRMITENGTLAIGEDKRHKIRSEKELTYSSDFKFNFRNNYTPIEGNPVKAAKRDLLFGTIFKVVVDGVISNVQQLGTAVNRFFLNDSPEDAPSFFRGFLRWALRPNNRLLARIGLARGLRLLLFQILLPKIFKAPFKFDTRNIMSMLADRGMFSGFAVREFFMDMVIYAATRNTRFHREFVKLVEGKTKDQITKTFGEDIVKGILDTKINTKKIGESLLKYEKSFSLQDGRAASKIGSDKDLEFTLHILSRISFSNFNEITKVNFGMCVSNFTTGFPVYFGHEWTPDFPVMEAVAASMTIPPAIKPLYNESDVVKPDDSKVKSINVQTDKGNIPFVGEQGKFELSDYYFYEHIVKLALAQEMAKPDGTGNSVNINVNSSIDLSTFLEELKNIVVEKKLKFKNENGIYTPQTVTNVSEIKTTLAEPVNGVTYTVDYTLYKFFYNAAYKGLFIDGGYRNNIPYNFFRTTDNKLDGVVAIKLDEHFPPDLMADVYNAIKAKLNKVETSEIIDDIDLSELDIPDIEMGAITELLNHAKTTTYKTTKADIITQTELVFSKYLTQWVSRAEDEEKKGKRREIINKEFRSRKGHKAVKRLVRSTLKTYRKQHLTPPWKKPKAILATAFEGYEYGSERGQVRHITDHNHILPLYDYGIGTYDFDMKKVMPMILLAQAQAEQDTSTFFK